MSDRVSHEREPAELSDAALPGEASAEASVRPRTLDAFVGQARVRQQLALVLNAAVAGSLIPDHVLFAGPPGLGKTSLAGITAAELGRPLRITSGPAITHAGDMASILTSLQEGEVLFIDEIHRLSNPVEEMLYLAMEDFRVDVVVGKGPGATAIPLELPRFTLVGATTRAGLLQGPFRDRFGFTAQLDYYDAPELAEIVARSATVLSIPITDDGCFEIGKRSRGTPRIANRLLRRVRDFHEFHHGNDGRPVDARIASDALALFDVDPRGFDKLDVAVLVALVNKFGSGPVGLGTLATAVGEEPETIEQVVEPFLTREGMLVRTPRGRTATAAAQAFVAGL